MSDILLEATRSPESLLVFHTNGQEIIAELVSEDEKQYLVRNCFSINREHIAVRETIGTMLILDALSEKRDEIPITRSSCSLVRKALKDEEKSYENIRNQMREAESGIVTPNKDIHIVR